jgi:hypothetical protein
MDYLTLFSIILGTLLIAIYVYSARQKRASTNLAQAAILFLSSTGFVAGVKVAIFAFNKDLILLVKNEGIESSYVFFGGVAICWVSIISAIGIFQSISRKRPRTQPKSHHPAPINTS